MDIRIVNNNFAVSPQITPDDLGTLKNKGYVAIINNRPDGEVDGQPLNQDISEMAKDLGLAYYHLPIISGTLPEDAISETKRILAEVEGPSFAFCRSGTRSITLWALAQAGEREKQDVINEVQAAGYDLPFLANFL